MSDRGEPDDPARDDVAPTDDPDHDTHPLVEGETEGETDGEAEDEADDQRAIDASMIANAKRRHGALGGVLAAGMLGLDQALGRKVREEAPIVVDANSDPVDLDTDGISIPVADDTDIVSPPLPRTPPVIASTTRRRRR